MNTAAKSTSASKQNATSHRFVANVSGSIRWDGNEKLYSPGDTILVQTSNDRKTTARVNGLLIATTRNLVFVNRQGDK